MKDVENIQKEKLSDNKSSSTKVVRISFQHGIAVGVILLIFIAVLWLYNHGFIFFFQPSKNTIGLAKNSVSSIENFNITFPEKITKEGVMEIVGFEEKENWEGGLFFESIQYFEGDGGIRLKVDNLSHISSSISASLDTYDSIKMVMYIEKDEYLKNIEFITIKFHTPNGDIYQSSVRTLKKGWSVVRLPKKTFIALNAKGSLEKIKKVEIEVKTKGKIEIVFDRMWAERGETWKEYFQTNSSDSLSLYKLHGKIYPQLWNMGSHYALMKSIPEVEDFTLTAKILPHKKGAFGLAARIDPKNGFGYYLMLNGIDTNGWRLLRYGTPVDKDNWVILKRGTINNFVVEKDKPYWLRITLKGSLILGYFSLDGKTYYKLTETRHGEFKEGGVGVGIGVGTLGNGILIESVDFIQ